MGPTPPLHPQENEAFDMANVVASEGVTNIRVVSAGICPSGRGVTSIRLVSAGMWPSECVCVRLCVRVSGGGGGVGWGGGGVGGVHGGGK